MKTIGMIGGITWNSTAEYYRIINQTVADALGGVHSAEIILYSFDFDTVASRQSAGDWAGLTAAMVDHANALKVAGADFIVICANTMHLMAPDIEKQTGLAVLHIADVTGQAVAAKGLDTIALLGTKFVMEGDFYTQILREKYHLNVLIPNAPQCDYIHSVIYDELSRGVFRDESREEFIKIVEELAADSAQGVVLGCTEIPLLLSEKDVRVPLFNTTKIHATAAAQLAISD